MNNGSHRPPDHYRQSAHHQPSKPRDLWTPLEPFELALLTILAIGLVIAGFIR